MNRVPYRRVTPPRLQRTSRNTTAANEDSATISATETLVVQLIISGALMLAVLVVCLIDTAPTLRLRYNLRQVLHGATTVDEVISGMRQLGVISGHEYEPTMQPETSLPPAAPLIELEATAPIQVTVTPTVYNPVVQWLNPVAGRISSPAGIRYNPITGRREFHDGVDIAIPIGTPLVAPRDGVVLASGYSASFGRFLRLGHDDYYVTFFAHLHSVEIDIGDTITQGQKVALSGNTGWSTAPHLHFSIFRQGQFVDPLDYLCFSL